MSTLKKEEASMSSEEMLDRSTSWTLACDNALLNRLKSFSESLTKNSQTVSKECDSLSKDISKLNYKLLNATNEFLMLSNNQFVENRVEEFEEYSAALPSSKNVSTVPKSKAEKEAELISKMKQAIQLGLTACNSKRQQNENGGKARNRFVTTMPYLIGSPKFFSSKYCGLVDESVRVRPTYDSFSEDSVSLGGLTDKNTNIPNQCQVNSSNPTSHSQNQVQFTMPPPPAFSIVLSDQNKALESASSELRRDNNVTGNDSNSIYHGRASGIPPPSPSTSDRSSSDVGRSSVGTSKENVPRSITDELNKIYGSFAPPPTVTEHDDSDDDFRPNASAGRIFDDDDDDIFGEKELFPSSRKNTNADFFERTNPSNMNIPTPVFSVPPPVNPVPQRQLSQPPFGNVQTLAGPKPSQIENDIPNVKSGLDDEVPKQDAVTTSNAPVPVPEAEEPISRTKLPAGAVSMFGGLPPPVFNNGTLQQAQTTKTVPAASSFPAKHDTQIISSAAASTSTSGPATTAKTETVSSQRVNVNQPKNIIPSQPVPSTGIPKRNDNISQGPSRKSGDLNRLPKKVPASSLFADESSDEDIFSSTSIQQKKHSIQESIGNKADFFNHPSSSIKQQSIINSAISAPNSKLISDLKSEQVKSKYTPAKKSIFDESESDEDLFSSKPFSSTTNKGSKSSASTSSDIFKTGTKKTVLPVKSTRTSSLFGDDSDSDSDLFGNKKVSTKPTVASVPVQQPNSSQQPKTTSRKPDKMADVASNIISDRESLFQDFSSSKASENQSSVSVESMNNNEGESDEKPFEDDDVDNVTVTVKIRPKSPNVLIADIPKEPSLTETKPMKKSIFEESDSDDDLFKSVTVKLPKKPAVVESKPSLEERKNLFEDDAKVADEVSKHEITKAEKRASLFENDSDSDSDLFSNKSKVANSSVKSKSSSPPQSPVKELSPAPAPEAKTVAETETSSPLNDIDTSLGAKAEEVPQKIIQNDEPKPEDVKDEGSATVKPVGSKISEKIKAMQSGSTESGNETEATAKKKLIKPKVSVKNLALNLNINPLALKVGAKPPKPGTSSNASTPSGETDDSPSISSTPNESLEQQLASLFPSKKSLDKDEPLLPKDESDIEKPSASTDINEGDQPSPTATFANDGEDHFVDIIKARAKIQRKRRPPSKGFLKSLASQLEDREKGSEIEEDKALENEPNENAT